MSRASPATPSVAGERVDDPTTQITDIISSDRVSSVVKLATTIMLFTSLAEGAAAESQVQPCFLAESAALSRENRIHRRR